MIYLGTDALDWKNIRDQRPRTPWGLFRKLKFWKKIRTHIRLILVLPLGSHFL